MTATCPQCGAVHDGEPRFLVRSRGDGPIIAAVLVCKACMEMWSVAVKEGEQ